LRRVESALSGLGCSGGPGLGLVLVWLEAGALGAQAGGLESGDDGSGDGLAL
jgi:hypothetical protein